MMAPDDILNGLKFVSMGLTENKNKKQAIT